MGFSESSLEQAIIDLMQSHNYQYIKGDNLHRELTDVLIEADLSTFLYRNYAINCITEAEITSIIASLKSISSSSIYNANKSIFNKIVNGETFRRIDPTKKDFLLQMFDFEHPENNIFRIVNQMTIKGTSATRRPDAILYINGLPVVVFEFKSAIKEDTTIHDAFTQLTVRYRRDIPELFKYNAFVVISDGVNTKAGSLFSDYVHFFSWRRVDEDGRPKDGVDSLYTMIEGMLSHERILDIIHNFIYFPDNPAGKELKIVCSYPQYFAARKLYNNILHHQKPEGDGKGGTYFGTTGCGKSYIMLFLTRLLMHSKELHSPTILIITDRTDLDDQIAGPFINSKEFIGDNTVVCAESREALKGYLRDTASGGAYLTTIQKFADEFGVLSERTNIICISDEAHRSQTNLDQKTVVKGNELLTKYGFAKFLHTSLPNATYVGFTGTPIDPTIEVFGNIVDQYNMSDSVKDGITVSLVYDGRPAKVCLDSDKVKQIENYYNECLKLGANEYQVEASKKAVVKMDAILGDHDRLNSVADYFIDHYETRVREGSTVAGKCMFLCANRSIGYQFYKILKLKRPSWFEEKRCADENYLSKKELKKLQPMPMCKMIATRGKDDPEDMYNLLGTDEDRKNAAIQFKNINSNFKIAIVVDMWLTGFDVPFMDTIYIDKPLVQKHNIIQTVSRVNRAYEGKSQGLIVDFFGIKSGLMEALKMYTDFHKEEFDNAEDAIRIVRDQLEVLHAMFNKFDNSLYFTGTPAEKLQCLNLSAEYIQLTKELETRFMAGVRRLSKAFKLCNGSKDFSVDEMDAVHYYMAVRAIIFKLNKGDAPDIDTMNAYVRKMLQEAIQSDGVEELFTAKKDLKMDAIDLFSDEYLERINRIKLPNTKIKILQQLLSAAISEFKKVNKIKSKSFEDRLKAIVDSYNSRVSDESTVKAILDDVSTKLIDLMKQLKAEQASFAEMGIDYEEKAFYDILVAVAEKFKFTYPDDQNILLAKEIREKVKDKAKYSDWINRDDIKAEMQCDIIMLLAEHGYPPVPPEIYEKVYADIIEQAENFRKYYD